jgi:hypothetical protein
LLVGMIASRVHGQGANIRSAPAMKA